jgi:hypothetical protein
MIIAVDFDGTIVDHAYPDIGKPVPGAIKWLRRWQELGAKLILWTMRSDGQHCGDVLTQALEFCRSHGIEFYGVNSNPDQDWSSSPKAYAHVYVDDAAFGCPLAENPRLGGRMYVDWDIAGPEIESMLLRGHIGA